MKTKLIFRIVSSLIMTSPTAFAESTNLAPEQLEVIERARAAGDNFEWAVMTKSVDGVPRTVVLMGEGFATLPDDSAIAKGVIDQFERFAVDQTGPYEGRKEPQKDPIETEPMNLTKRGAKTKSIENAEQLHRWGFADWADGGLLTAQGFSLLMSLGYFVQSAKGGPTSPQRTAVLASLFVSSAVVFVARGVCPTCFPLGKSRAASMAKFIDGWIKSRGHEGPLVVVVKKGFVDELREVLSERYFFRASAT